MKRLLCVLGFASIGNCYSVALNEVLPDPYPEVYNTTEVLPFEPHGWYGHHEIFTEWITKKRIKIAIEIGSWLGASTRDIAKLLPRHGVVFAVDTWKGSIEHQPGQHFTHPAIGYLFQQFISNVIHENLERKIIPVRLSSVEAAESLKPLGIRADFIYIDGAHDYDSVIADIRAWYPYLRKDGIFCGDDYTTPGVAQAVHEFADENDLLFVREREGHPWRLIKK